MEGHIARSNLPALPPFSTDIEDVLDNIDGHMHGPMTGFVEKYFGTMITASAALGKATISDAPTPDNFLQWFSSQTSSLGLNGAQGKWHIHSCDTTSEGRNVDNGTLLLLATYSEETPMKQTIWSRVQVVGLFHHCSGIDYQDGLLSLCQSATQVFVSQPTRLFLHGFYMRGSLVEFWMFDRSGLYCSNVFDIRKDLKQFHSAVISYNQMTDQELGKTKIVETDQSGNYIVLDGAETQSLGKLYIENDPIASSDDLVGSGMTCYRARLPDSTEWNFILKFKWRWARDRPEDELPRIAEKRGVHGALCIHYYKEFQSTSELRSNLRWGVHKTFVRDGKNEAQAREIGLKSNGLIRYTEDGEDFFKNRVFSCIVTSPVGRPLHTFQSRLELLQVLCDAIRCHRSLLQDAAILHQDVSPGNIIILDHQDEGKPRGVLIDLDSAIELRKEAETNNNIVGTRVFMAIGVLKGEHHTYRHDLESFLYVLLWTIITNHAEAVPRESKLRQWGRGSWDDLTARKTLDMDAQSFQSILTEFPSQLDSLKALAESLRRILFSPRHGVSWTGTDSSPEGVNTLYDRMIDAFQVAIESEKGM